MVILHPVKDTFCIDRFKKPRPDEPTPTRPRPIVLKLILLWDHCVLLSSHFNLKHFGVKYFVLEDLPPEACQQCKKNFACRQNISGSKLADAGHSTVLGDSFQ